jgi:hypothetical protein
MTMIRKAEIFGLSAVVCLLLLAGNAAGAGAAQTYYIGDTVKLSGYSYESSTVYLFLTGPNLPPDGVALDNINLLADQGGFTEVSVDSNDHWEYNWDTGAVGGRLDAGAYTVWAVDGPNDLSRLGQADYTTISVMLGTPGISVETPVVPGTMDIRSNPDNASVVINNNYRGKTPLTLNDLDSGVYNVTFSRFGYGKVSMPVNVEPGATTEVTATLAPLTGTLAINTSPAGARLTVDGADTGLSPVTLSNLTMGDHIINATKDGYIPAEQQVSVIANQTLTTDIVLQPVPVVPFPTLRAAGLVPATLAAGCLAVLLAGLMRLRSRQR